jgi:hypothetical protein
MHGVSTMEDKRSFFSTWFGFSGWNAMSAQTRIATQIMYRVFFLLGLAAIIVGYGTVTGSDPGGAVTLAMIAIWYLLFQFILNFHFRRRLSLTGPLSGAGFSPCSLA